ncbi:MAG: hypothetical protein K6G44_16885 [Lentisphaeria bacterium]|nr:hypothetical protein [Lentisphaeria bacterium]
MKRNYATTLIAAMAFLLFAYFLFQMRKTHRLIMQLAKLQETIKQQQVKTQKTDTPSDIASPKQSKPKSAILPSPKEIMAKLDPQEVERILEQAKHDMALSEAFQKVGAGGGMAGVIINTPEGCNQYWESIQSQNDSQKAKFSTLANIVSKLDFSYLPKAEQDIVSQFVSLREQLANTLYDNDVSAEEKVKTFIQANDLYPQAEKLIKDAIDHTYGERMAAYRKMHDDMSFIIHRSDSTSILDHWINGYRFSLPEGFKLP